jgi:hypothetical protein
LTFEEVGIALAEGSCKVDWLPLLGLFIPLRSPYELFMGWVKWLFDLIFD